MKTQTFKNQYKNSSLTIWIIIILVIVILLSIIYGIPILTYKSITKPLDFNKEKDRREALVIQDLKDIRACQNLYLDYYGNYCDDFDTLLSFIKIAEIPIIKQVPDPNDESFSKTINDTIGYLSVADSLFRYRAYFILDSLPYIPGTGMMYEMQAGVLERSGLNINVFEVKAHYNQILKGLDSQRIINLIKSRKDINKFPGLKVGSMKE